MTTAPPDGQESSDPLATLAAHALDGDRAALNDLCQALQAPIYRLALRMFSRPEDAADATQEALVRIVTNLGSFEGRAKLLTWAYTIASRQFLRLQRTPMEASVLGPEAFGSWLDEHRVAPSAEAAATVEFVELCGDVRISCTYGMLLCLSRDQRLAYLLGDVVGFTDVEGADALGTTPAAFRQRLARARRTMRSLMAERCGLVRSANPCRCGHLVAASVEGGLLDPSSPRYARHPGAPPAIAATTLACAANELDVVVAIGEVFRSDPAWELPAEVAAKLTDLLPTLWTASGPQKI
jgi:RNA polymerase sigma factor (sigma-70 family)